MSAKDAVEPTIVESTWRERVVDRSLRTARARAVSRGDRFLQTAIELLSQTGRTDFTVQELVERSRTSLRSFYQHFASKDELLLALFDEVLRASIAQWREEILAEPDDFERMRMMVTKLYAAVSSGSEANPVPNADPANMSRALTLYHLHLAESRPADFAQVLAPQRDLVREIIEGGIASGAYRQDMTANALTMIVMQTLVAAAHMHALGAYLTGEPLSGEDLWSFIRSGLSEGAETRPDGRAAVTQS